MVFLQGGFGVEGIDLGGAAFAEDVDDAFCFGFEVRLFWGEGRVLCGRVCGGVGEPVLREEGGKAECSDAESAAGENVSSGDEG